MAFLLGQSLICICFFTWTPGALKSIVYCFGRYHLLQYIILYTIFSARAKKFVRFVYTKSKKKMLNKTIFTLEKAMVRGFNNASKQK